MKTNFFSTYRSRENEQLNDPGFGTKGNAHKVRLITKDGKFNTEKTGEQRLIILNIYHHLIDMSWWRFSALVLIAYLVINLFFTGCYALIGFEHIGGMMHQSFAGKFLEAFFFSTQSFTTVGYGRVNPIGTTANILASLESLTGLMFFALATGLIYGRFARPNAKLVFSKNAIVAPYQQINGVMLRLANARLNQLIEIEATVILSWIDKFSNNTRRFVTLDLERKTVTMLPSSWTLVHPITETSPFFNLNQEDLLESQAELMVSIKAYDESYSQTVYARCSYLAGEFIWGVKFAPLLGTSEKGKITMDMSKFHAFEKTALNG